MKAVRYRIICMTVIILSLSTTCKVDKGYHHFINAEEPEKFRVTVTTSSGFCGAGSTDISVTALNSDETINTDYKRSVNFTLISTDESECSFTPEKSPPFTNGQLSLTDIAINGNPTVPYQLQVNDENYDELTGISEEFSIGTTEIDHFEITGVQSTTYIGIPYSITVTAVDVNGARFNGFDGNVDIRVYNEDDNFTITTNPETTRLSDGQGTFEVTVNGTDDFILYAVLSADQPEDVACLGGLDEGGGMDDGEGDGDGGAGGGDGIPDGGDGSGGTTAIPPDPPELSSVTCDSLTLSKDSLLKGESFNIWLSITILDQYGGAYNPFSTGSVEVDLVLTGELSGLLYDGAAPTGIGVISNYPSFYYATISDGTGTGTISANITVTDDGQTVNCTACCSGEITVIEGIGVYTDNTVHTAVLINELESEPRLDSKTFLPVTNTSQISGYTALIVDFSGTGYNGSAPLGSGDAELIRTYYNTGKPILIATDDMSETVRQNLAQEIWGVNEISDVNISSTNCTFSLNANPITSHTPLEKYLEADSDGYTYDSAVPIVTATVDGADYGLILTETAPAKAILMSESIYHEFEAETTDDETQWWEENQALVVDLIEWLLTP